MEEGLVVVEEGRLFVRVGGLPTDPAPVRSVDPVP